MMSWIAAGRSGIQIINERSGRESQDYCVTECKYIRMYKEISEMTCYMCHAALPVFGIFETEKYSKVTIDEALWCYLAATTTLRDSQSLVHKPWRL